MSSPRKDARWGIAFHVVEDIIGIDWNTLPYRDAEKLLLAIDGALLLVPGSKHYEIKSKYFDKE